MPATIVSPGQAAARPAGRTAGRKSPLRVVTELQPLTIEEPPDLAEAGGRPELGRAPELTAAQLRRLMISEFRDWLRSRTNRNGRPFQADTISAYADAAVALDAWMTAGGIDGDFTAALQTGDQKLAGQRLPDCPGLHQPGPDKHVASAWPDSGSDATPRFSITTLVGLRGSLRRLPHTYLALVHRRGCGLRRHTPPPPKLSPLASGYPDAHFAPQDCTVQTRTLACSLVWSGPAPDSARAAP